MTLFLSVLLFLLKLAGWVLVALLLLAALLLIIPSWAEIEYAKGEFSLWVKILGIKIKVLDPNKDKKVKTQKKSEPVQKPKEKDAAKRQKTNANDKKFVFTLEKLSVIISTAGTAIKKIFKHLHIHGIILIMPILCEDAAATAINTGKINGVIGGCVAVLENFIDMRFKSVKIFADYTDEYKCGYYFYCKTGISLGIILVAGIYAFIKLKQENVF